MKIKIIQIFIQKYLKVDIIKIILYIKNRKSNKNKANFKILTKKLFKKNKSIDKYEKELISPKNISSPKKLTSF